MDYYINPIWFYLMQVSNCLYTVLFLGAVLTFGIAGSLYINLYVDELDDKKDTEIRSKCKKFILTGIILIISAILMPTEKTCLKMMIASQVTKENVTNVKEEIYDIVDYIDEKLDDDKE